MSTISAISRIKRRAVAGLVAGFAVLGLALGMSVAGATPAFAHDELVGYTVEADPGTGAARTLVFSFSNEIMNVGSELRVESADGKSLNDGPTEIKGRDVRQGLVAELPEGVASVVWRVVSSDGHPISGEYSLTVAADGSAVLGDAAQNAHDDDHDAANHDADDHSAAAEDGSDSATTGTEVPVLAVVGLTAGIALVVTSIILMVRRERNRRKF